jgi:ABC-type transporter Mla subunit MlaD
MSHVFATPELIASAAADLATIGSNLSAARRAAAAPMIAVAPAAADEVSALIAYLFSQHAQDFQAVAAEAATFHDQFAQKLTTGAFSYASIENAISSNLQGLPRNPAGYLLGGVGKVGLLPQIAWDIYTASHSGNSLGLVLRPLDLLLFPLDLVY